MFLSRKQMMESPIVQEWIHEGALMAGRKDILIVLRARLKLTETDEFAPALERITDMERIDHLFDVAIACATIDQFRAALSLPPHPAPSSAPAPLAAGS